MSPYSGSHGSGPPRRRGCALPPRLWIALAIVLFGVIGFFVKNRSVHNPVTDETHRVALTVPDQVALGLQAAPKLIAEYGGEHPDPNHRQRVEVIGRKIVEANTKGDWAPEFTQYRWGFHLLADPQTINAFALPGGQVFFTHGLYKFLENDHEVAGVLGHEIAHVIAQHSAQQMAKSELWRSIANAVAVAGSDGQYSSAQTAQFLHAVMSTKYSRSDESQADKLGVQFIIHSGYNPEGLLRVMKVLEREAGGGRAPEFLSTHPNPGNRFEHIQQIIADVRAGRLEGPK
jgi:predicted Zn-dependent protease